MIIDETVLAAVKKNFHKLNSAQKQEVLFLINEWERRQVVKKARGCLLDFITLIDPTYKVGAHHKKLAVLLEDLANGVKHRIAVNIAPRFGKKLADNTPILTPLGWTTHGKIRPGDFVFHPSGKPVRVLAVNEKSLVDMRVTFANGSTFLCHEEHEWTLFNAMRQRWETLETRHFLQSPKTGPNAGGKKAVRGSKRGLYFLPDIAAVQFPEKALLVDPYTLGAWLGDGTQDCAAITHAATDWQVVARMERAGYTITRASVHKDTGAVTTRFGDGKLRPHLRLIGVIRCKHIPQAYKQSSIPQRMELLAGLVDTDGTVDKNGKHVFYNTNKRLVDDVVELATSLGWRPYVTTVQPKDRGRKIKDKQVYYHVGFQPTEPLPLQIPRKRDRFRKATRRRVALESVIRVPADKAQSGQCIHVDSPDGLYLVGEKLTPTHNSYLVSYYFPAWFLGNHPDQKVMMVSHTADLAVDFGRKVRNLISSEPYQAIFGGKGGVELSQDSKSAGRWHTNHGGEYFACLRRDTLIRTQRGLLPASQVVLGDRLTNCGQPVTVQGVYHSRHEATHHIAGLRCSGDHPIWTVNRGWVYAKGLLPTDVLRVESIPDTLKAIIRRGYGYLEHATLSSLVWHQVPLHQPPQREVARLRGAWDHTLRALAAVREFCRRHRGSTYTPAYSGAHGQQWAVQPGELPLGDSLAASQQHPRQRASGGQDHGATRSYSRDHPGGHRPPDKARHQPAQPSEGPQEELRAYSDPEKLGWVCCVLPRLIAGCRTAFPKTIGSVEGYLAGLGEAAQKLCGLLLGVRWVGKKGVYPHPEGEEFINFRTDGDHTFFADGVLTHNCGVGGAIAGRGADLLLIDDPHNEQDIINGNLDVFDKAYEWFTSGARTRLMPGGRVAIVQTRWALQDLTGRVVKDMLMNEDADQYEVVEFPAVLECEEVDEAGFTQIVQKSLWPEQWSLEALLKTKASMPSYQWSAQYQQNPTAEEGAIVKREWWRWWERDRPPKCDFIIQSWDTAFEKHNRADFSACTTWGVWWPEKEPDDTTTGGANIILLNAFKERLEFPELKQVALNHYREWKPDSCIVEKKASGAPLIYELRALGIPVQEFTPSRGNDKISRLNSVSDLFSSGIVWAPQTRWAEEVADEIAAFPAGEHDDLVDATTLALMRFRSGGFVRLPSDEPEPLKRFKSHRGVGYY